MKLKTIIIGLLIAVFGFTSFAPVMAVRAATDEEINAALSAADESAAAGESVLGSGTAAEALDLPEPGGDSASNTSSPQDSGMDREEIIQKIANAASIMHRIFSPMINAFTFHIGNFLKTDYIFSDAMDSSSETFNQWGVKTLPTSFLIASDGKTRYRVRGNPGWEAEETINLIEGMLP